MQTVLDSLPRVACVLGMLRAHIRLLQSPPKSKDHGAPLRMEGPDNAYW